MIVAVLVVNENRAPIVPSSLAFRVAVRNLQN